MTTPISRLVSTARTTSALSCSGDGTGSLRCFRRFGVILRTRRERTRSAHGDRLDRLVFLVGWHVGVRGELDGTKNFVSGLPLFAVMAAAGWPGTRST